MNILNDDLINEYIDNSLTPSKLSEINEAINKDEESLTKIRTHKFIHETLKEIPTDEAPFNFTEKVMTKISETIYITKEAGNFFKGVLFLFGLLIAFVLLISFIKPVENIHDLNFNFNTEFFDSFKSVSPSILSFLNDSNILMIGAALILLMLIAAFFMMESHYNFKKKFENFSK